MNKIKVFKLIESEDFSLCFTVFDQKFRKNSLLHRKIRRRNQHNIGKTLKFLLENSSKRFTSVSHKDSIVVVVSSKYPVGIDIERIKNESIRSTVLSSDEKLLLTSFSFTEIWTLKESISKLVETGLPTIDTVSVTRIDDEVVTSKIKKNGKINIRKYYFKHLRLVYDTECYKFCLVWQG